MNLKENVRDFPVIVYGKNAFCKLTAVVESYKYHTKIRNPSNGTAPVTETAAVQKDSFGPSQQKNNSNGNDIL